MKTNQAQVRLTYEHTQNADIGSIKLRVIYQRDSRRYALSVKDGVVCE